MATTRSRSYPPLMFCTDIRTGFYSTGYDTSPLATGRSTSAFPILTEPCQPELYEVTLWKLWAPLAVRVHILELAVPGQSIRTSYLKTRCFIETLMRFFYNHNIQLVTSALIFSWVKLPNFFLPVVWHLVLWLLLENKKSVTHYVLLLPWLPGSSVVIPSPPEFPFSLELYFHLQRFTVSVPLVVII